MLSTCNSVCLGAFTLTETTQCDIYQRSEIPVRLLIATCDTAFPEGTYDDNVHGTAVAALFTSGNISATFELSEFSWGDPTTTKKNYKSSRFPAQTITTGRQLTAKDYASTDTDASGGASPYEDRLFYKNVVQNKAAKIRGYVTDNGMIYLFLDSKGNFCSYDINFFTGYDTEVEGRIVEFKNYVIDFVGDPMKNITLPYLDIIASGAEGTLGWLFAA